MARTFVDQENQIHSSDSYLSNIAPGATMESNAANLLNDLNAVRSQLALMKVSDQSGNWYDDLTAPSTFTGEGEAKRGVDEINQDLHDIERKRVLRNVHSLVDVTVGAGNNFVILGAGELPSQTTAAVGAVTTLGTVVASHGGTFGTHALSEVAGPTTISPLNLMIIVDGASRDPILSSGRQIYGLLQGESGVTDGATITTTTTTRVQISFVRINAAGDDLEACPVADIENAVINYTTRERVGLDDLNEYDFLSGAIVDVPAGSTVTRQVAYDNQGATPVDLTTNAILDLEGAGLEWQIRDDLEALLFRVIEGSAGGTSEVEIGADVDLFDVDAAVNVFAEGATLSAVNTRPIEIGVTDGLLRSTAGDLEVRGTGELLLNDGNLIAEATWAGPGVKLSDTTTEVTDYETAFGGEVSLFNAIVQAYNSSSRTKGVAVVTTNISANTNVTGAGGSPNIDAQLPDYSTVTFVSDVDVYVNGILQRNGANSLANHDVYPGTSAANGDLAFEYNLKSRSGVNPDVITMIVNGA